MKNRGFLQLEKHLDSLFANALKNEVFSGASAAVFYREGGVENRVIKSYGRTLYGEQGETVTTGTVFDLASLTKPLCTVLCILCLIEDGKLDWSTELKRVIRGRTSPSLNNIQIGQLLSHSSGLIDYRPFFKDFKPAFSKQSKKRLIGKVLQEHVHYDPGSRCLYSDLGYILLGEIIERISETELDRYFREKISGPLQLDGSLFFRPYAAGIDMRPDRVAATEVCPWRKRLMHGEVHDEHCWLMGGVAGHAGLFGTAAGVLALTEHIRKEWQGRSRNPSYSAALLQRALNWKYKDQTWSMGFDRPSSEGSSAGKYLSKNSVGHLGYTGTSFWIDPERDLIAVLLTNRVHPTRKNEKIKIFRPRYHDTIVESIWGK